MHDKAPDLILFNGIVQTMEGVDSNSSAVAISENKIIYIGSDDVARSLADKHTELIDLKGRLLLPGFHESHMHPIMYAHNLLGVECGGENTASIGRVMEELAKKVQDTPKGEWIKGFGWDDSKFAEGRNLTRWDLDQVAPDNPVLLTRTCVHVAVANSMALKLGGIDKHTPDPEGGHIQKDPATGEPTGILQERAMELLPNTAYSLDQQKRGMKLALEILAKKGVTAIGDMSAQPEGLRVYQQLYKENQLTCRVRLWAVAIKTITGNGMLSDLMNAGIESGFGNEAIKLQGVKYVLDGSVSGRTAAVTEPFYKDASAHGIIYCDNESEMTESVRSAFQHGLRVSIHAIGDRAIEFALNVLENAGKDMDLAPMRNRVEHCVLPTRQQLQRIRRLGLIVGSSIGFLYSLGEGYLNALGPERVKIALPQRSFQEMGIIAPLNTDCPVCDVNPLWAIYSAIARKSFKGSSLGSEECVDIMEALRGYTTYPAYSTFDENSIGTIREGKLADLVVLDKNILVIDPEEVKDTKVLMTIMDGKIVWRHDSI